MATPLISSKLPNVGTTIFTVMSQLAVEYRAINLAQGFPDFPCSERLIEYAERAMRDGWNQYAPMPGMKSLREKLSAKTETLYGRCYNPDTEITITPGGTAALFSAISAVVGAGDEVIVFEPFYDSYIPVIELAGGVAMRSKLRFPEYRIDWDEVRTLVSSRTKLIILNTPHNPTGTVWSADDMLALQAIVQDTNIIILSDEVYEHIIFDGREHQSVARFPELAERSFIVFSFGKTYHVTGWKVGYCLAPEPLMREFRKVHQFVTFCTNTPAQHAFAGMLDDPMFYTELGSFYQQKRDHFRTLLAASRFELLPSEGSYFQLARYDAISNETDTDFAVRVTKEYGVATIPVSVFYSDATDNKVVRFCFAKTEKTLTNAAEILCKI